MTVQDLKDEFYLHHSPDEIREELNKRLDEVVKDAIALSKLQFSVADTKQFESIKTSLHSAAMNIFFEKISMLPIVKQQYGEMLHQSAYEFLKHIGTHIEDIGPNNVSSYIISIFTHARSSLKTQKLVNSILEYLEIACNHSEEEFLNVDHYSEQTDFFLSIRKKILSQEHIATEIKYLVRKGWTSDRIIDFKHYDSDFWNNTIVQSVIHYDSHALQRVETEVGALYSNFIDDVNHWLVHLEEKFQSLKIYIKNPGKFHALFEKREKTIRDTEEKIKILLKMRTKIIDKQVINNGKSIFTSSKELSKGSTLVDEYNSLIKRNITKHFAIKKLNIVSDSAYDYFKSTIIHQLKELQKVNKQLLHLKLKIIDTENKKRDLIRKLKKQCEFPYILTLVSCIALSISIASIRIYKYKVLPIMLISFIGVCFGLYKNYKIMNKIRKIKSKKFL